MTPSRKPRRVSTHVFALEDSREALFQEMESRGGEKMILLLTGELGAGKTTLVRDYVKSRSGEEATSPTFALHHRYSTQKIPLEHWDLYRLNDQNDLESTGFWDTFTEEKGWILIEWGNRLQIEELPLDWPLFELKISGADQKRRYEFISWDC